MRINPEKNLQTRVSRELIAEIENKSTANKSTNSDVDKTSNEVEKQATTGSSFDGTSRQAGLKRVVGESLGGNKRGQKTAAQRGATSGIHSLSSTKAKRGKRGGMLMAAMLAFQILAPTANAMVSPMSSAGSDLPTMTTSSRAWELRLPETKLDVSVQEAAADSVPSFTAFDASWKPMGPEVLPEFEGKAGHTLDTKTDVATDGKFLGKDRTIYAADTLPELVSSISPEASNAAETVFLVNGIMTDSQLHQSDMQALANTANVNVVGIRNATAGMFKDVMQSLGDKLGMDNNNHAVATTASMVYASLSRQVEVHLVGHSQGATIISEALDRVQDRLGDQGLSKSQTEAVLAGVHVTTFAGAATNFPDGPRYDHWINKSDVVPLAFGVGLVGNPGKDAQMHTFDASGDASDLPSSSSGFGNVFARWVDQTSHGLKDIYLPNTSR